MTLEELLAELRNNILHDRSDRVDGDDDRLWSDATLVRYINEAYRRFARRSLVIRDKTSEATKVTLQEGVDEYALHPSIIAVLSARVTGDRADLTRAGHTAFDTYRTPDPIWFDVNQMLTANPGRPMAFSTDERLALDDVDAVSVVTLRVYPVPSAAEDGLVIGLRVIRGPLDKLDIRYPHISPEIPEDYHLDMLNWAAALALRMVDRDAEDATRQQRFESAFEASVMDARNQVLRKMFAPVGWKFGQNGFIWDR